VRRHDRRAHDAEGGGPPARRRDGEASGDGAPRLSYLPLERFFDVVVGSDDTDRHKPDPAPLEHALGLLGAGRDESVYVGDSPFDIRAAKGAGMHSIAVTWGGIHPASGSRPKSRTTSSSRRRSSAAL
jgi:pyrophosphatase PpaX